MENHAPEPFGTVLKRLRRAALLTQEQLAARAHLSPDAIRALEHGKRRTPRPDSVRLLADALALAGPEREVLVAAALRPTAADVADAKVASPPVAALPPAQPTPLLGRAYELQTIRERLTGAAGSAGSAATGPQGGVSQSVELVRLLTLTGPAGVGKTRLALAAAAQLAGHFADGVMLVDLSPVRDPLLVLPTIARTFGLNGFGSRPLPDRLHDYLRSRSLLLVLDNFEQVLPAAGVLADMLSACPALALLVTSRVPLRLRWEWTLRVAPLPVPDLSAPLSVDSLKDIPAVALFVERSKARRADFALTPARAPLIARIASELDGLPLALELAAARLDVLPLSAIALRLGDRLRLLRWEAADVPERQQSLEAAIGWSYDLLTAPEQRLFRCLGAFAGQISLDAAMAVVAAMTPETPEAVAQGQAEYEVNREHILEQLASLAEKSLLLPAHQADSLRSAGAADTAQSEEYEDAEPAFAMLETVREYAWERLVAAGESEAACRANARYFLALAERADPYLRAHEQRVWYRRLEREQPNLRAALRWLLDHDDRVEPTARMGSLDAAERETALRLAAAMCWFWWTRGYLVEGRRWLDEALRRAPNANPAIRIRALLLAGTITAYQGAFDAAAPLLDEALALAKRRHQPVEIARALAYSGMRGLYAGDVAGSIPRLREALARVRALDDAHLLGLTLLFLGAATFAEGDDDQAAALFTESLARFEAAGDALWAANLHVNLGWFTWRRGDLPAAIAHIHTGLIASALYEDRRLLAVGGHMVLSLPWDAPQPADLDQRVLLLGAVDALSEATGMTLLQSLLKPSLEPLRDQITRAGLDARYREGSLLPFHTTAALAHTLLERVSHTQPGTRAAASNGARTTGAGKGAHARSRSRTHH
jgi:non-specific serine/threonine protein kinase